MMVLLKKTKLLIYNLVTFLLVVTYGQSQDGDKKEWEVEQPYNSKLLYLLEDPEISLMAQQVYQDGFQNLISQAVKAFVFLENLRETTCSDIIKQSLQTIHVNHVYVTFFFGYKGIRAVPDILSFMPNNEKFMGIIISRLKTKYQEEHQKKMC